MIKVTMDLNVKQAEELIRQLPMDKKIALVRRLEKETRTQELKGIISSIQKRRKASKITSKEIKEEIERARKEFYARHR